MEGKKGPTMKGALLNRVDQARKHSYAQAVDELWKRNKIKNREEYKVAEITMVQKDGTEIKEFKLYKLIDATVVTISSQVNVEIALGKEHLTENRGIRGS